MQHSPILCITDYSFTGLLAIRVEILMTERELDGY